MDLNYFAMTIRNEVQMVSATLKDKGRQRFGRPLAIGAAVVLGAYVVVYKPSTAALRAADAQIAKAKSVAKYAEQYSNLHDQLSAMYYTLPLANDRETWLLDTVRGLLDSDGLVTDQLQPPTEEISNGFAFQTLRVTLSNVKFNDIAKFVQQIDNSKPFATVSSLEIDKKDLDDDMVTCEITTVIAVQRMGQ